MNGRSRGELARRLRVPLGGLLRWEALWWQTLLNAAILSFVAFYAGGGLHLAAMTTVEMSLTLGAAAAVAGAVLLAPARGRAYGLWPTGLLLGFGALTALSVVWSVQPDNSWQDAGRLLAYGGVFGAAVAIARAAPARWPAVLGGVALAAAAVCGYALLTKVFPAQFDANDVYARLRAPYEYWNATGLTAAMGVVCCMWLGARRSGHALLSALAYPAMGLMLITLMLAYSRGALVALALGLALWFCTVPLRLRGATLLIVSALGAAVAVAWDFSDHALSAEGVALSERTAAGHQLGVLLAAILLTLALAGAAIGFSTARSAPLPTTRMNAGAILLALLAAIVIAFGGALGASDRGFTGSVSHAFNRLTDTHAAVPNTPDRLTAIASARAQYWNEALKVFNAHPALGAGAEGYATARLRYRRGTLSVRQAHGFVVQTLADLGVVGLVLALALLVAWMAAAGRCTHPFNRSWTSWRALRDIRSGTRPGWRRFTIADRSAPYTAERIAMLSMLCVVVVFGIHSLVDWTWYVPGDACVALLCAGWLAGRGPLALPLPSASSGDQAVAPSSVGDSARLPAGASRLDRASNRRTRPRLPSRRELSPTAVGIAGAALLAALLAVWAQWQPQRSIDSSQRALALLATEPRGADAAARTAVARDPLSAQALFTLSEVQQASGKAELARTTLQRAVRLQPSNPETWARLGEYDVLRNPRSALDELGAAIYLNPQAIAPEAIARGNEESIILQNAYVEALRATMRPPAVTTKPIRQNRNTRPTRAQGRDTRR
jgi:hypothetical protein